MGEARNSLPPHGGGYWEDPLTFFLILSGWWWTGWMGLLWPHAAPHHLGSGDGHCQLPVPEPIEADGEHGLFA